jgi:hypothetical protein
MARGRIDNVAVFNGPQDLPKGWRTLPPGRGRGDEASGNRFRREPPQRPIDPPGRPE